MNVKQYISHIKLFLHNNKCYKNGTHRIRYNRKLFFNFLLKGLFFENFTISFSEKTTSYLNLNTCIHVPPDERLLCYVLRANKFSIVDSDSYPNKTVVTITSAM